jgi:hypothetical protein
MEASAADDEIESWRLELERGRRIDARRGAELVLGHEVDDVTSDLLWMMLGPEVFLKCTTDLGFTAAEYESFMKEAFMRLTAQRRQTKTG